MTGYPFPFTALKEGVLDLMGVVGERRLSVQSPLTVALLAVITGMAIVLKDVGFVVSFGGALFGCMLMLVVPAYMNIRNVKAKAGYYGLSRGDKVEITMSYGLLTTGLLMTVLGVGISVLNQMGKL